MMLLFHANGASDREGANVSAICSRLLLRLHVWRATISLGDEAVEATTTFSPTRP
jgi:hypothetical protein